MCKNSRCCPHTTCWSSSFSFLPALSTIAFFLQIILTASLSGPPWHGRWVVTATVSGGCWGLHCLQSTSISITEFVLLGSYDAGRAGNNYPHITDKEIEVQKGSWRKRMVGMTLFSRLLLKELRQMKRGPGQCPSDMGQVRSCSVSFFSC